MTEEGLQKAHFNILRELVGSHPSGKYLRHKGVQESWQFLMETILKTQLPIQRKDRKNSKFFNDLKIKKKSYKM